MAFGPAMVSNMIEGRNSRRYSRNTISDTLARAEETIEHGKKRVQRTQQSVQESLMALRFSEEVCAGAALVMAALRSHSKQFGARRSGSVE